MNDSGNDHRDEWAPQSLEPGADPATLYDEMRGRCPVAYNEYWGWSLFRRQDVLRILNDPSTFSSAVSAHRAVPSGLDPPEHTTYRRVIDKYFEPQRILAFEPHCRKIVVELIARLPEEGVVEMMSEFAEEFALRAQCAFLEWPAAVHEPLRQWTRRNQAAVRSRDRSAMARVALEFDHHIRQEIEKRRKSPPNSSDAASDAVRRLLVEEIDGERISDDDIVSILRNWTVGELATISACIGIVAAFLAARGELQSRLRRECTLLPYAIDEILRIDAPLITARRVATADVEIAQRKIARGERLTTIWPAANRDESAFDDPKDFRFDRDPRANLLYGAGIHICPGAGLARAQLRIVFEELLATTELALVHERPLIRAMYPSAGFASCPIAIAKRRP